MASNNDQAMITMTGFSNEAFKYLLPVFAHVNDEYSHFVDEDGYIVETIESVGRPRTLQPENCLPVGGVEESHPWVNDGATANFWDNHDMSFQTLQFIGRYVMRQLKNDPLANIVIPSHDKLQEYKETITCTFRHPVLQDA